MNPKPKTFKSNGKLLLTGEYVVLDGAIALAVPTKLGQSLEIEEIEARKILWKSYDEKGAIWYEEEFLFEDISPERINHQNEISQRVIQILNATKKLNPEFLTNGKGFKVSTKLEFPKNWGLGTSSTLINNIANWAKVDAYKLLDSTFGGSGYDIACAQSDSVISYQLFQGTPIVKKADFNPSFKEHLYFIYLNKKKNSREGIAQYKKNTSKLDHEISTINEITAKIIDCQNLDDFEKHINQHEQLISKIIKQKTIKASLFSDFNGSIKSLGAWGGDFVLVASKENPTDYFLSKGFSVIIPYRKMIR